MSEDTKSLRIRIHSVDATLHLTKAMGLVASSKIRRANSAMTKGREYAASLCDIISRLTLCGECKKSPYMRKSDGESKKIIVIAGDRGLCGGYNVNVFRLAREYPTADFIPIGKRACDKFGKEATLVEGFSRAKSYELAKKLCKEFVRGDYDELAIIGTKYVSIMLQEATYIPVLPIKQADKVENSGGMLFEPNESEILDAAAVEYVSGIIMAAVREGFACEVAARRMAMDNAGKNAEEMISALQLSYNRARQSAITQEITEIVAGSGQ